MSWTNRALILLFAVLASAPAHSQQMSGPAQIILLRHAEKPADAENPHLSPAGVQRAEQLVSFITKDPAMTSLGLPVAVFATQTTKHDNGQRTQETVAPLAKALKLPVQTPFLSQNYAKLARQILANPGYVGKTVLICWTRDQIPNLAAALGVKPRPSKWKESVFDRVYVISYQSGNPTLAIYTYEGNE